ncbi:MAG TPA: CoA-transferase [Candidatus Limnocylindria bacterium]
MTTAVEARRALEARPRQSGPKVMSAAEAIALVRDGDHVAIGGCLFSRTPIALVHELIRSGRKRLEVSRNLMGQEGELLMAAGAAEVIVTSWQALGLRWGISRVLREMVESGRVRFEEWSHLALGLRYRAGAMGVPFLPTMSMLGSDLAKGMTATISDPFSQQRVNLVPALFPDVALIHAHRADVNGNARIDGYAHMDFDVARAARTVIVSAEEIVDVASTRAEPDRTTIPSMLVDAVVHAPDGAFPGECYARYETDWEHYDDYVAGIASDGLRGVDAYIDRLVRGTRDHAAFIDAVGRERLEAAKAASRALLAGPYA